MSETSTSKPPLARRRFLGFSTEVWAWSFYDLANTIFSAIFVSMAFPDLITKSLGGTKELVGRATAIASILSALLVPLLGAISDQLGRRLPILVYMTVGCCLLTPLAGYLPLRGAFLAGAAAMFAYYSGLALYDSILADIASKDEQGRASGLGTGIGYGGTLIALACVGGINAIFKEDSSLRRHIVDWMIGINFLVFSLPLFLLHRERGSGRRLQFAEAISSGLRTVKAGMRSASPQLWLFVGSMLFTVNGVMAVIVFFRLFAIEELNMSENKFIMVYALLSLAALVGSVIFGRVADRLGHRIVLFTAGFMWLGVLGVLMFWKTEIGFIVGGMAGGAAMGAVWTASRPLLISLADPERVGETFGFLGIANRSSAVLGPWVFGLLATRWNYQVGQVALMGFFIVGMVFLYFVRSAPRPQSAAG